jgi:pimeloyl-ACP methyl ester carboxylesterase
MEGGNAQQNLSGASAAHEVHRDVSSGVVRLRTTEWRTSSTPEESTPIVMLPGVLAPRLSYRAVAQRLAPRFRVIAVDFPGFGESEKPSAQRYPYGVSAFAEAIADLFGGLDLARAHILGHGVGGAVALRLAAQHPELVRRLALIAPLAHPSRPALSIRPLLAPMVGGLLLRQLIGKTWFSKIYRDRIHSGATSEALANYYEALATPASRSALLATLRASQDSRGLIADSRLVRAPSLILWGRQDRLFPVEHGRYLSREMPHAGLEILSSGHAPHEECPDESARILGAFFDGQRAGSH